MTEIATIGTFDEATWPGDSPASSRGTVLLIEDEEFVREGASEALRSAGYSVLTARNAAEANQQFREWGQAVDLMLADVVLPDEDGRSLGRRFQARNRNLKILFISGYADQIANSGGRFEQFLAKPFSLETLLRRVGDLLGQRSFPESGGKPVKLACDAV